MLNYASDSMKILSISPDICMNTCIIYIYLGYSVDAVKMISVMHLGDVHIPIDNIYHCKG